MTYYISAFLFQGVPIIPMSNLSEEGVMKVKSEACDRLLAQRVEVKLKNAKKMDEVVNRLHIAMPKPRDNKERPPFIPEAAKKKCMSCFIDNFSFLFFWYQITRKIQFSGLPGNTNIFKHFLPKLLHKPFNTYRALCSHHSHFSSYLDG